MGSGKCEVRSANGVRGSEVTEYGEGAGVRNAEEDAE